MERNNKPEKAIEHDKKNLRELPKSFQDKPKLIELNRPILYLVTDRAVIKRGEFLDAVENALKGGVNVVQLREKGRDDEEIISVAKELKELTKHYNVPLIINDSPKIARLSEADGVHLGMSDGEISEAREFLGRDAIIGGSARTIERALLLENQGADYLGVGAVFGTSTKADAKTINTGILSDICHAINIPVVAIGGVNKENIIRLKGTGASGIAVVSAIMASNDIYSATKELNNLLNNVIDLI